MRKLVKKFISDESGLELVEYGVMTALIVAVLVVAIGTLSGAVSSRFGDVTSTINDIGVVAAP